MRVYMCYAHICACICMYVCVALSPWVYVCCGLPEDETGKKTLPVNVETRRGRQMIIWNSVLSIYTTHTPSVIELVLEMVLAVIEVVVSCVVVACLVQ